MPIGSSGQAWNPAEECGAFRAVKSVEFTAKTEEDAVFLARLWGCIRRGRPVKELAMLVNALHCEPTEPREPQATLADGPGTSPEPSDSLDETSAVK